jgi:hypothetical protein
MMRRLLHTRTVRVGLKHQRREKYDSLTISCNSRFLNLSISVFVVLASKGRFYYVYDTKASNAMKLIPGVQDRDG